MGPAILLRFLAAVYPSGNLYLSVFKVDLLTNTRQFVGLRNFQRLLADQSNHDIMYFTLIFILASVALRLILGLGVASMLNAQFPGRNLVRTISPVPDHPHLAGLAFRWMLDDQYGLVTDWLFGSQETNTSF